MELSSPVTYLNTAACGLVEETSIAVGTNFNAELAIAGSSCSERWRMVDEPRIRTSIASFIGAQEHNIAMVPNFSWAINGIVQSLKGNERILLYKRDYPSLTDPFKINNFNIKWIEDTDGFSLPAEAVFKSIENKEIDIVALSHVQYNSGYKLDINKVGACCREHGVVFIVDATQSMGSLPIHIADVQADILIASNYKWMNAGFGTGIMYISDSFIERYPPVVAGNNSYRPLNGEMMYVPSANSYEPGHPNMYGLLVLEAAIQHKLKLGLQHIEQHDIQLTTLLLSALKEMPVQLIGPYDTDNRTSVILLKDENGLSDWIRKHNIIVTNRNNMVRISLHYYNTDADVMQLINCLQKFN